METVTDITNEIWTAIRFEYENSKISMKELAVKYNTYAMKISRMSIEEKWIKYKPTSLSLPPKNLPTTTTTDVINPFDILGVTGTRKVMELIEELGEIYSPVDEPLLISYAESYERYLKLVSVVNTEGEVIESPKTGGKYMNPSFSALQSVKADMAKLGDKLGLSIASRKRLKIEIGKKKDTASLFDFLNDINDDDIVI
ncbi:MAG: phage terminase small subunit P27 family [Sulfurovum sp.]